MTVESHEFTVGEWAVYPFLDQMRRGDEVVRLEPKVMDILVCLARRGGEVVSRKELTEAVWRDTFVEDQAVTRAIWQLRQAFGGEKDEFLETIPKRGYRLTAPVRPVAPPASAPSVTPRGTHRWRLAAITLGCFVTVAAIVVISHGRYPFRSATMPSRVMLAVLPFENLTGNGDQEYLCDGLTEEMTTRLGALDASRVGVIARTSSNAYKKTTKRVDQIGRELNADYVVEGSVRRDADRVRITAQLINTRDQAHLWARSYEDDGSRLLRLYDEVAQSVTEEIRSRVAPGAKVQAAPAAVAPEAREAYLRGRYSLSRGTGPAFLEARNSFNQAIEREAVYAPAWAGLATSYIMLANYNVLPPAETRPKAKEAALKALYLDPSQLEAHLALAGLKMEHEWDFKGAEQEFRRAIEGSPNSAQAHQWYGALLAALGRFEEGIDEVRRARELDPVSLRVGVDAGRAYYFARRYDLAVQACRKVIALEPRYPGAHTMLGLALLEQRRYADAIAELELGVSQLATKDGYSTLLGYAYAVAGRRADAEKALARQIDKWSMEHVGATAVALTYVGLGDKDAAFTWLNTACDSRDAAVVMLKAYPYWDAIRNDPRFRAALRRVGLPE